jgi:hypothetical protein
LFKCKFNPDNVGKIIGEWDDVRIDDGWTMQNMLTKSGVTILNKFDDLPIESRKINYRYYISEAKKVIADFTEQQLSLF